MPAFLLPLLVLKRRGAQAPLLLLVYVWDVVT